MRKVIFSKLVKQEDGKLKLEEIGEARFHQFGSDYEEFESGGCSYSTAIIEKNDGSVENIPVNNIRFID